MELGEDMVTTTKAHEATGMSRSQIQYLCKIGRVKATRVGRDWLLSLSSLQGYIRAMRAELGIVQQQEEENTGNE